MRPSILLLLAVVVGVCAAHTLRHYTEAEASAQFQAWMVKHGRSYATEAERLHHFESFKSNMDLVYERNLLGRSFTLGLNINADLTNEEYRELRLTTFIPYTGVSHAQVWHYTGSDPLPLSVDWTQKPHKMVTNMKDQGQCGSCWAFGTTCAIESAWNIKHNLTTLVSCAEQQFLDCDKVDGACNGGDMTTAYEYVMQQGYLDTEKSYPYRASKQKTCKADSTNFCASISGYLNITATVTDSMAALANLGPYSIGIDASSNDFQLYQNGIYTGACSSSPKSMDHCIAAVGYKVNAKGTGYWLARNSWGTSWGNDGYIEFSLDEPKNHNTCGFLNQMQIPVV